MITFENTDSGINHRETTEIIGQLNSAVHYHEEWFDKVTQQLVCRTRRTPERYPAMPTGDVTSGTGTTTRPIRA
ncbi:MAG: hypothetical protein AB2811_04525 [Candidatus Sedimenticola endophacoides]